MHFVSLSQRPSVNVVLGCRLAEEQVQKLLKRDKPSKFDENVQNDHKLNSSHFISPLGIGIQQKEDTADCFSL